MKQITFYLLSIVLSVFMSSWHDEDFKKISWSQYVLVLIKEGISFTSGKTEAVLKFTTKSPDISVSSNEA